jgi:hypothetical protein
MGIMIINLSGEIKEYIKYTFNNILYYPNDVLFGIDDIDNTIVFQPTRIIGRYKKDNTDKPITEEVTLCLDKIFNISDDVRLFDISKYDNNLLVIFSRVMLVIFNIKDLQIKHKREHKELNDIIYSQKRLVCIESDQVTIYSMCDMTNPVLIKGSFFVNDLSNVFPGMMAYLSKIDQNYISIYNIKEDKFRQRSIREEDETEPIYTKVSADDSYLKIAVLDRNWKLKVIKCRIK